MRFAHTAQCAESVGLRSEDSCQRPSTPTAASIDSKLLFCDEEAATDCCPSRGFPILTWMPASSWLGSGSSSVVCHETRMTLLPCWIGAAGCNFDWSQSCLRRSWFGSTTNVLRMFLRVDTLSMINTWPDLLQVCPSLPLLRNGSFVVPSNHASFEFGVFCPFEVVFESSVLPMSRPHRTPRLHSNYSSLIIVWNVNL